jgi:hypothetical protein
MLHEFYKKRVFGKFAKKSTGRGDENTNCSFPENCEAIVQG